MNAARHHRVATEGLELHVAERGSGPPLLVLHGFTGSHDSMAKLCEALAQTHRVLALDLVGHGESDAPLELAPYSMERCVSQIRAVLRALGAEPAHVVGYSMGGRAALCLLARDPGRVRSALLVGASAGLQSAEERAARRERDEALARSIEREGLQAFVERWMAQPLFASQSRRLSRSALKRAREQRLANRPHGLANALRGMGTGAQPALHGQLAGIATPVLFAAGAEDAKFAAIARDLAALMPRAEVALVEDAGHAAHLENPAAFLAIAQRFLMAAEAA